MLHDTVRVRKHERGLWFRYGEYQRLVGPGTYRLWSRLWSQVRNTILVVDTLKTHFEHPMLDVILEDERAREALLVVDLDDTERALIWKDGRLEHILGPGRHAFWQEPYRLKVEPRDRRYSSLVRHSADHDLPKPNTRPIAQ